MPARRYSAAHDDMRDTVSKNLASWKFVTGVKDAPRRGRQPMLLGYTENAGDAGEGGIQARARRDASPRQGHSEPQS
jgi:hypothetical protein